MQRPAHLSAFAGGIIYVFLVILATLYYKERTIFVDIAFHTFYILKDSDFAIQNFRWGAFITQLAPLLTGKLGLSLQSVLISYSLIFVFLQAGIFYINLLVFKSLRWAWVMLLFSVLMVTHTFYWIQSEYQQGIALMVLFFAWFEYLQNNKGEKQMHFHLMGLLLFALAFMHPLLIFPFAFCCGFIFLRNTKASTRKHIGAIFLAYGGFFLVKSLFFKTAYDTQAMHGPGFLIENLMHVFNLASTFDFIQVVLQDYYIAALIWLTGCGYYFWKKQWLKLALLAGATFGYILLICCNYPQSGERFYMENLFLGLSVMVIVPIVFDLIPAIPLRYHYVLTLIIIVAFSVRIFDIYQTHRTYSDRIDWERTFLHETKDQRQTKLIVNSALVPADTLLMTWATSYEFLLLSTLETGSSRAVIIDESPDALMWALPAKEKFITKWGVFGYEELPSRYFHFKDTIAYQVYLAE